MNAADCTAPSNITPNLNIMMIYDTWVNIDTSTLKCVVEKSFLTVPEVLGMSKSESVPQDEIKSESGGALASYGVAKMSGYKNPTKLSSRVRKN